MSWELNLNQREKKDIDTASCHRSRPPDGGRPCRCRCRLPLRRQDQIWGRFRLVRGRLAGQGDQAVRVGRDLRPTALGERLRSEEHTSELQSLMRISYAVFCLKKTKTKHITQTQY